MNFKPQALTIFLASLFPCFVHGLSALTGLRLRNVIPQTISLRGGGDQRTGKFVVEHRKSNYSMIHSNHSRACSFDDLYDVQGVLGSGGFATVRKAVHRITKKTFAVKTIDLCKIRPEQLHLLRDEVEIMKMLDHPNVIKLYETFEEDSKLHLVLELCDGGDLFDFMMKTSVESGQKTWTDGLVSKT